MNKICTIGFTNKTLEDFITRLKKANVERVVDIRLNNSSQLAGFAKSKDLEYVLKLVGIEYVSVKQLAPDKDLLDKYHEDENWNEYEKSFKILMTKRDAEEILKSLQLDKKISCFLCSEDKPTKCHRRLVAEMLGDRFTIEHL